MLVNQSAVAPVLHDLDYQYNVELVDMAKLLRILPKPLISLLRRLPKEAESAY
jgi:hypothetical protein